jgi:hypothetical protein
MADLLRVSVKQLEMAYNCPRKWAYHYLEGVPQVEGEALAVGNAVHAEMKRLILGEPPQHGPESFVGKMCRELFPYAKNESGRHVPEIVKQVHLPEYKLKVDLRADYLDRPTFKDWKTTGAPYKTATLPVPGGGKKFWALQSLEDDFQANIYAFLLMREHWRGQVDYVDAQWCYVSKKFKDGQTPKTWTVEHRFWYEDTLSWFETYVLPVAELIRSMREAWNEKTLDSARIVPHNPKACEGQGTFCDAAGHCAFKTSPAMTYSDLHLPIIGQKGLK